MRRPPAAGRRDANEAEIVRYLRTIGASVQLLNQKNVPDLLVGWRGHNILIELKSDGGKLKPGQKDWHLLWRGQVATCETFEECLEVLMSVAGMPSRLLSHRAPVEHLKHAADPT